MRKTKHWLMTIAALLCSLTLNAHTFEVDGIYYDKSSNNTVRVTYKGSSSSEYSNEYSGTVIIPATVTYNGITYDVIGIKGYAFSKCSELTTITLPESVTKIEGGAFSGCSSLISINIPEGVTCLETYTFLNCSSLTSIILPESITSFGEGVFNGCSSLTSINIPKGITNIKESTFNDCESLTSITIPNGVTSIEKHAFSNCKNLESVIIPETVTTIGECAFKYCKKLTDVSIPNGVTSIEDQTFYNCESLTSITIPEGVTNIGRHAFYICKALTSIVIPEGITSIKESTFYDCESLTSITIPEGVMSIGNHAFSYCYALSITCMAEVPPIIEKYTFNSVNKKQPVLVPLSSMSAYQSAEYWSDFMNFQPINDIAYTASGTCGDNLTWKLTEEGELTIEGTGDMTSAPWLSNYLSKIKSVIIGEGVTSIGVQAFEHCQNLSSINIPTSVTVIWDAAFGSCHSLTSITIPNSVTRISSYAFINCSGLKEVELSNSLTYIQQEVFRLCSSLTSITIPSSVGNIGAGAFSGCSSLTSIICESVQPPYIQDINAFYRVDKSISVYVPFGSVSAYQFADGWNEFTNIKNMQEFITINQYGSGTYCSEYALDFSEVEGLKAYAATGYNTKTGIVTLTRVMTSQPGMGLFLKGEAGEYSVPTLESTDDNSLNMLVGTLEKTTVNSTSDDGKYLNYKYTKLTDDEPLMFHQFKDGSSLSAGKAYLQIPAAWVPTTAKSISLRFDDGEGTTDIEETELTNQNSEIIYDLMGRKVSAPQKGMVYIVNGKKTVF